MVKCGVNICSNTCCEHMQLINIELRDYTNNGLITCNLILRVPCILEYKSNQKKIQHIFVPFSSKINFTQISEIFV